MTDDGSRRTNLPPSFSVIMPLYNKAPHVEAAVRSALNQNWPAAEVVLIDDGSTDGSLEIVNAIDDDRLRVLQRSPPGPGGYAARNLGIRSAKGDWIAFLDADDLWTASHLEDFAAAILACPSPVGCAFSRFDIVSQAGRRPYPHSDLLKSGGALALCEIVSAWLETGRCPIWTGACAFRKDLLTEAALFPEIGVRRGGDKDMWLRALARSDAVFVDRSSAQFHHDTVNRVTHSVDHSQLPIIVRTIATLLKDATPEAQALLKRLSDQEVLLYARHSAGNGIVFGANFFRAVYQPFPTNSIKLAGYWLASLVLGLRRRGTNS
jgi:hypothetical protein